MRFSTIVSVAIIATLAVAPSAFAKKGKHGKDISKEVETGLEHIEVSRVASSTSLEAVTDAQGLHRRASRVLVSRSPPSSRTASEFNSRLCALDASDLALHTTQGPP